jgi:hypothetical protein
MSEAILIGTRGWDHDAWQGGFYPEELPPEWRICYYSNVLRAVWAPADAWAGVTAEAVVQWAQDSDSGFRFILEPPPLPSPAELTAFLKLIAPIFPQTDGFLLRVAAGAPRDLDWLETVLAELAREHPVCADLPTAWQSSALSALLAKHHVGHYWDCTASDAPSPGGALLVALSTGGTPLELRRILEAMARWQGPERRAALFFDGPDATESARTARTLAELMGI